VIVDAHQLDCGSVGANACTELGTLFIQGFEDLPSVQVLVKKSGDAVMSMPKICAGPFSNTLVIDLTHVLNGPFGTTIMGDLGARVIKVETPGHGDDTRTYGPYLHDKSLYFSFVNRGKESIVLNLKDDGDRAIFLNMVAQADVLAENFRPGVMARLGFSYDDLAKINPRLVYASSSGFGQTGPLANFPAYDTIIQAMSGIMSVTGFPDGAPTRVGTSLSDLLGGLYMFSGIASALFARERTGKGAHVDIAMFDSTLAFLEQSLMEYVATGSVPKRIGNRHPYIWRRSTCSNAPTVMSRSAAATTICSGHCARRSEIRSSQPIRASPIMKAGSIMLMRSSRPWKPA
jgi:crotonobetainyl-CoA:carnitine CoA-transferase CaiB-like acyl-CoA transferase